jgi:hypothetical protein
MISGLEVGRPRTGRQNQAEKRKVEDCRGYKEKEYGRVRKYVWVSGGRK